MSKCECGGYYITSVDERRKECFQNIDAGKKFSNCLRIARGCMCGLWNTTNITRKPVRHLVSQTYPTPYELGFAFIKILK